MTKIDIKEIIINNEKIIYRDTYIMNNGEFFHIWGIENKEKEKAIDLKTNHGILRICDYNDASRLKQCLRLCQKEGVLIRIGGRDRKSHIPYSIMVKNNKEFDEKCSAYLGENNTLKEQMNKLMELYKEVIQENNLLNSQLKSNEEY